MTNARSLVNQAARKINVLGIGQTLSAEEASDGLQALNNMLDTFSVDGGYMTTQTRETFSLNGSESYTIGSGGDFNTPRPIEIISVFVSSGGNDYPLTQINAGGYASIPDKASGGIPDFFYYDNNNPLGSIFLHPKPSSAYTLTMYSHKALTNFANLTTEYDLAPGMENMLVHNLAEQWAPEFEKEASQTVKKIARVSKNAMLGANKRNNYPTSSTDGSIPSGGQSGDIYNGYDR